VFRGALLSEDVEFYNAAQCIVQQIWSNVPTPHLDVSSAPPQSCDVVALTVCNALPQAFGTSPNPHLVPSTTTTKRRGKNNLPGGKSAERELVPYFLDDNVCPTFPLPHPPQLNYSAFPQNMLQSPSPWMSVSPHHHARFSQDSPLLNPSGNLLPVLTLTNLYPADVELTPHPSPWLHRVATR
jgi:hypothetical protein